MFLESLLAKKFVHSNATSQASKIFQLPKTKRNFEILWGKLRWFNLFSQISTWTGLDRASDTISAKLYNSSCMTLNLKSFCQKNLKLMHRDKSAKMAIWQKIATLPFWHFCPCASISKILLVKWLLVEYYERAITHFCWKSVSGPVQACPCTYLRG